MLSKHYLRDSSEEKEQEKAFCSWKVILHNNKLIKPNDRDTKMSILMVPINILNGLSWMKGRDLLKVNGHYSSIHVPP
jgi:hypothetical protein